MSRVVVRYWCNGDLAIDQDTCSAIGLEFGGAAVVEVSKEGVATIAVATEDNPDAVPITRGSVNFLAVPCWRYVKALFGFKPVTTRVAGELNGASLAVNLAPLGSRPEYKKPRERTMKKYPETGHGHCKVYANHSVGIPKPIAHMAGFHPHTFQWARIGIEGGAIILLPSATDTGHKMRPRGGRYEIGIGSYLSIERGSKVPPEGPLSHRARDGRLRLWGDVLKLNAMPTLPDLREAVPAPEEDRALPEEVVVPEVLQPPAEQLALGVQERSGDVWRWTLGPRAHVVQDVATGTIAVGKSPVAAYANLMRQLGEQQFAEEE